MLATIKYLMLTKVYRRHFEPDIYVLPKNVDGFVTFPKNPLLEDVTDGREHDSSVEIVLDGVFNKKSWL